MNLRTLLSYFRPSKASVEPVSHTDDPGRDPAGYTTTLIPSFGGYRAKVEYVGRPWSSPTVLDALVKREHTPFPQDAFEIGVGEYRGISINGGPVEPLPLPKPPQHPLAPEHNPPPLDWGVWTRMARENQRRGWSFCRYAARGPTGLACLFGIVRGPWGIAKMDFWICGPGAWDTLHSVTHLPSGVGFGLFTDQDSAAVACDIASRLKDDFEALDLAADAAFTREAVARMHTAWTAAGITPCATHAHASADHNSPALAIWFQDYNTVVAGRPEGKLS